MFKYVGGFLVVMGATVLFGHLFGPHWLTDLGFQSDMAPSTAICFIVIGLVEIVKSVIRDQNGRDKE